ncbi:hypothetical protein [Nonomuraea roseola]|uniref:Resolvase/invertase-type recombinase catalytic domain-containing protein n=1 Tax=Nonomuraea roseola TaxID=46179 RepID=A0ABV5QDQ1_9ACTN
MEGHDLEVVRQVSEYRVGQCAGAALKAESAHDGACVAGQRLLQNLTDRREPGRPGGPAAGCHLHQPRRAAQLATTVASLEPGDALVITKPDRVARSMKELLVFLEEELATAHAAQVEAITARAERAKQQPTRLCDLHLDLVGAEPAFPVMAAAGACLVLSPTL